MTKEEQSKYEGVKPIGVYPMSNWGGVEVIAIEYGCEDYVIARYNFGKPEALHRCKIMYGQNVTSFRLGNKSIRLDEVMRV